MMLVWPSSRMTTFRRCRRPSTAAGILDGPPACSKNLRHGFGVQAVSKGIALNMAQKRLGYAHRTTTAIYADAVGEEKQASPYGVVKRRCIYLSSSRIG